MTPGYVRLRLGHSSTCTKSICHEIIWPCRKDVSVREVRPFCQPRKRETSCNLGASNFQVATMTSSGVYVFPLVVIPLVSGLTDRQYDGKNAQATVASQKR